MKKNNMNPKVFISYAWSNEEYKEKVLELAKKLKNDGVEILIDRWDLKPGNDMYSFMEKSVSDPSVTNVLILLDPVYKEKADNRKGGVGTETQIISVETYEKDQTKYIPVVMEKDKDGKCVKPIYLNSKFHCDLSNPESYENNYKELVSLLYGKELCEKPKIGKVPDWISDSSENPDMNKKINLNNYNFEFTSEFKIMLENDVDEKEGNKYMDYFVFPALESKNINDDFKNLIINDEDKFLEIVKLKKKLVIEGGIQSGKTILSKYIVNLFFDDLIPIYLNEESFVPKNNEKIIKYAFYSQYGDEAEYEAFLQLDKCRKIIIIDNCDKIPRNIWTSFSKYINNSYEYVIEFTNIRWNIDIKEKTLDELSENEVFYLQICPFYYEKRKELIRKIYNLKKDVYSVKVHEKVEKINEDINNQIKYFQLTPYFIHQFTEYYINFSYIKTPKESTVFSKVFEANITFRIAKNSGEDRVDMLLVIFDFIAYYIHINKNYTLDYNQFEEAVNNYNKRYDNDISLKLVRDIGIKSNIIREVEIENNLRVEFCDENLLAYFTAIHLNRLFNEGEPSIESEINDILNNICFGINGDIILFISYLNSNMKILYLILNSIYSHMEEWVELDLDLNNVNYLSDYNNIIKPFLPCDGDKKRIEKEKTEAEKTIVEKREKTKQNLYSYDEKDNDNFENKVIKSIRYLDLISKILPNFRHILKKDDKDKIVSVLYEYPNKLLYYILKDIDENYKKIVSEILDENIETKKGKMITEVNIDNALRNQSIVFILSLYNFISINSSTERTIKDLNKFDFKNSTTYMLQNMLMQENTGSFKEFCQKADYLYDKTDSKIVKQMIIFIVRKYFLHHNIKIAGLGQRMVDKYFGEDERKDTQILQAKNRIIKK